MPREKDTRDYSFTRTSDSSLLDAAERTSDALPAGQRVRAMRSNAITGTPGSVAAENVTAGTDYVESALDYVREQFTEVLGFSAVETPEFVPDPHVQQTTAGTTIVHLHQQYHGIPVFEMTRSVQFGADRKVERVVGDNVSLSEAPATVPLLTAAEALRLAAQYLAEHEDAAEEDAWGQTQASPKIELPAEYVPTVISAFERPNRPTVLDRGPFGKEVDATLVFFYTGPRMHLCWKLLVAMPDLSEQYLMLVAADRPLSDIPSAEDAVLLCQRTMNSATANVFMHNPGTAGREVVDLPRLADTYPVNGTGSLLPNPFPAAWWVEQDRTVGNCVVALQAVGSATLAGTPDGESVLFDPAQPDGDEQRLLNAFFFCNYMHDFFYLLGFDEPAGNFQKVNFTSGGSANDAVLARVHQGAITGTATFGTPVDGVPPALNLGVVNLADGTKRHTALDSDVVFHEYVHGVTNRLVGGRMNSFALQQPQSKGMGEGWGDYFALTIHNHGKPVEKVVTGDWVAANPAGIRSAPYDQHYPNRYGRVGMPPFTREHRIGEIWCAALMQMSRNLDAALGAPRGHQLGWQIVVDGLKLTPANPSFLDARDAILKALEDLERQGRLSTANFTAARRAAWNAFARFGIGAAARTNGASLQGIVEDTSVPPGV